MKKIKLTQGKYVLVDDEDFGFLNKWKWYFNNGYAVRVQYLAGDTMKNRKFKRIYIHRLIMNAPNKKEVDHQDRNGLNNQKSNLRICNRTENQMNRKISINNTSGFKGVDWSKQRNKWIAKIKIKKKQTYLGLFNNKKQAALAYNQAAQRYFGEFAKLNPI